MSKKNKNYVIMTEIRLLLNVNISADNLNHAFEKATKLKRDDLLDIDSDDELIDCEITITGLFEN